MDFHGRLNEAAGDVSFRKLGRLTDTHPETVRRYMQGQAPSATFLTNLCSVMGISGEWLLTGKGPMKCAQMRSHALNQADPSELMTAVANTLTDLCDRMDRLERFVQGMETRIRGGSGGSKAQNSVKARATKLGANSDTMTQSLQVPEGDHERSTQSIESKPGQPANNTEQLTEQPAEQPAGGASQGAEPGGNRAQRIRDAIAKRPS
jgi:hypothetical protein